MKIIYQLTLGFFLVSLLVGIVAYFGINAADYIGNSYNAVGEETLPIIETLNDLKFSGIGIVTSTYEFVSITSENKTQSSTSEAEYAKVISDIKLYDSSLKRYEDLVNKNFPEKEKFVENIRITGQKLQKKSSELIELKKQGVSGQTVQEKLGEFEDAETEYLKAVDDAIIYENNDFAGKKGDLTSVIINTKNIILIVSSWTFVVAIIIGAYISSYFSKQIVRLKDASVEIGKGNLDTKIDIKSKDEIEDLAHSFNKMAQDLKKSSIEITSAKNFLDNILKSMADTLIVLNTDKTINSVNPALLDLLGYKENELIGKPVGTILENKELFTGTEMDELIKKGYIRDTEKTCLAKDGRKIPMSFSGAIMREEGEIQGIVCVAQDMTEHKRVEEIRRENEQLVLAGKAKSEFLATMSHELRTPLNSIIGFSELLKQKVPGELNEKQEHYLNNVLTSGKNLLSLINDILDLSKIEAGKMEINIEKMSVPETINEALNIMKEKAASHNIILKNQFDPEVEFIEADRLRFKQVLFNLLSNAVKFSKNGGGTVTITTKKKGDMAGFSVSDTGIGIREEDMGRLFKTFEQLDSGITRNYGGTGLGLAISKKLVELHGGKIMAESKYGEGSTFTFFLPVMPKADEIK